MDFSELLGGFVKLLWVVTWICQNWCMDFSKKTQICQNWYMDFSELQQGFVKLILCISCPLPNKTKLALGPLCLWQCFDLSNVSNYVKVYFNYWSLSLLISQMPLRLRRLLKLQPLIYKRMKGGVCLVWASEPKALTNSPDPGYLQNI